MIHFFESFNSKRLQVTKNETYKEKHFSKVVEFFNFEVSNKSLINIDCLFIQFNKLNLIKTKYFTRIDEIFRDKIIFLEEGKLEYKELYRLHCISCFFTKIRIIRVNHQLDEYY